MSLSDPDELYPRKVPTEVYSRVCGYYRPVDNFNAGKKQEFEERLPFVIPKEIREGDDK